MCRNDCELIQNLMQYMKNDVSRCMCAQRECIARAEVYLEDNVTVNEYEKIQHGMQVCGNMMRAIDVGFSSIGNIVMQERIGFWHDKVIAVACVSC